MQLGAARSLEKLDNKSQEQYTGGSKNFCSDKEHRQMGQATRTTKLVLDLGKRTQGGANTSKQAYLEATVEVLSAACSPGQNSRQSRPKSILASMGNCAGTKNPSLSKWWGSRWSAEVKFQPMSLLGQLLVR
jgi:hypothetical protein